MSLFDLLSPFQTSVSGGEPPASTHQDGVGRPVTLGTADLVSYPSLPQVGSPGTLVQTLASVGAAAELPESFPAAGSPERVQVFGPIAAGGMGAVASAFDRVLLRRFAQKTMLAPAASNSDAALRFVEEAQITAQLDHPHIVPVHDLGLNAADGKLFFSMKLVDGETLAALFGRLHAAPLSGPLLEAALGVFLKVCDAVSFAHSRGVVHRDLKPDNVMVGSHGQVYVMDWGVALLLAGPREEGEPAQPGISVVPAPPAEAQGTLVGTVSYMAPEQADGRVRDQGVPTDVFGLGGILHHLLTGRGPNAAPTYAESLARAKAGDVPDVQARAAWPSVPPGLCRITMKALAAAPRDRYASVHDLRRDVEEFLRGGGWFQTRAFEAGEVIVREGEGSDAAYIVREGTCEVYRAVAGERQFVRHLGPGEIFGETGLLTRGPRTASVAAVGPVRVLVITPAALDRELDRSGWLRILVEALAVRFRDLERSHATA
ncbi:MAG: cyclic nucleotide-binding domain-containing protein, partial [Deltaproteobacteria bacterium]|nr:cyclic nucleotide-binding domain-containing protein [Deltaproteobacteria bacterium]